jgi:hypothetical protein
MGTTRPAYPILRAELRQLLLNAKINMGDLNTRGPEPIMKT